MKLLYNNKFCKKKKKIRVLVPKIWFLVMKVIILWALLYVIILIALEKEVQNIKVHIQ